MFLILNNKIKKSIPLHTAKKIKLNTYNSEIFVASKLDQID